MEETNVSNSSTAGYVALRASIHSSGSPGNGGGQDSVDITSSGDLLADALVRTSISSSSSAGTSTSQLGPVNQLFDITGSTGILNALQQFSTSFSNLSVSPNDQTLRSLGYRSGSVRCELFPRRSRRARYSADAGRLRYSKHGCSNQHPGRPDSAIQCPGARAVAGRSRHGRSPALGSRSTGRPGRYQHDCKPGRDRFGTRGRATASGSGRSELLAIGQSRRVRRISDLLVGRRRFPFFVLRQIGSAA